MPREARETSAARCHVRSVPCGSWRSPVVCRAKSAPAYAHVLHCRVLARLCCLPPPRPPLGTPSPRLPPERTPVCISAQVGIKMACRFSHRQMHWMQDAQIHACPSRNYDHYYSWNGSHALSASLAPLPRLLTDDRSSALTLSAKLGRKVLISSATSSNVHHFLFQ